MPPPAPVPAPALLGATRSPRAAPDSRERRRVTWQGDEIGGESAGTSACTPAAPNSPSAPSSPAALHESPIRAVSAEQPPEPSALAAQLSAGLAALEAGADFDLVERALADEARAAAAAEAAAIAAAARW